MLGTLLVAFLAAFPACKDVPAGEVPAGAVAQAETTTEAVPPPTTSTAPAVEARASDGSAVGSGEHFGAPFALDGPALSLSEALAMCADSGAPCRVEGTIDDVCQRRGCWFSLVAPDVSAPVRVRMQDYGFFVPTDSAGADCTFEGTLTTATVTEELAQHYADEAAGPGETPRSVAGPETAYEFVITGVELRR